MANAGQIIDAMIREVENRPPPPRDGWEKFGTEMGRFVRAEILRETRAAIETGTVEGALAIVAERRGRFDELREAFPERAFWDTVEEDENNEFYAGEEEG